MKRLKGFTLIELLVVVAIIALLLAILIPSLQRSRKQAFLVACQSNLKQLGVILEMYTDKSDGFFFGGAVGSDWDDWVEIFQPSYGKIKLCPLAKKTAKDGGKGIYAAWLDKEGEESGSYGLNGWVSKVNTIDKDLYWGTPYVKNAKDVPVFLDSMSMVNWPDQSSIPPEYDGQLPKENILTEQMKNFCINRHGKGETNCLFMDWSVNKVGLKELWKLKWNKNFNTNGLWTQAGGVKSGDWPQWMREFKDY